MMVIITVFIVILFMITLMSLVLKKTIKTLDEQSKSYFVTQLQNYDHLIDDRETKLKEITKELEEAKKKEPFSLEKEHSVETEIYDIPIPTYQSLDPLEGHRLIEETFAFDVVRLLNQFLKYRSKPQEKRYQIILNIQKKLDFDRLNQLLADSKEQQRETLITLFTEEEQQELTRYQSNRTFQLLDFVNYLEEQRSLLDPMVYVKVGRAEENYDHVNDRIQTQYQSNIYAGIMILYQNELYDYSLSEWEG